jgi:hypothetical protein
MRAQRAIQIALRGVNEAGAGVLESILRAHGVEVIGRRTFDSTGDARLVVALPDAARAASLLRGALVGFEATPVVVARLGEPAAKYQLLMELTHAGVQVSWFYALAPLDRPTLAVFKTEDDNQAVRVIRDSPWEFPGAGDDDSEPANAADCAGCNEGKVAA